MSPTPVALYLMTDTPALVLVCQGPKVRERCPGNSDGCLYLSLSTSDCTGGSSLFVFVVVRAGVIVSLNASNLLSIPQTDRGGNGWPPKLFEKKMRKFCQSSRHMSEIFVLIALVARVGLFEVAHRKGT